MICNRKTELVNSFTYDKGNYLNYINRLYQDFFNDFINNCSYLYNRIVIVDKEMDSNGKHKRFWHLISNGKYDDRLEASVRAERFHWIKEILEDKSCPICEKYHYFEELDKRIIKAYILCEELNYLIVFRKTKYAYYLLTAYVISESKTVKLAGKALLYKKAGKQ